MKFKQLSLSSTLLLLLLFCTIFAKNKKITFVRLNSKDMNMTLGGRLKEDYFFYQRARTLSDKFFDQNDFFRHRLQLDFNMKQGEQRYGTPATEAGIRLTNYVIWQQNNYYLPFSRDDIRSLDLDSVIVANDVTVKTLMPIIFVEEGWFKINFETFWRVFNKNPTFLKIGFFRYIVGRGLALGYHDDLAVEYLGWPGEGNYTRYPSMPPGILLHSQILKSLALEFYYMKWREIDANLNDVTKPTRLQRLNSPRPERGTNKDRDSFVLRFQYTPPEKDFGDLYVEPYWIYTRAPENIIEFEADASSNVHTLGAMVDFKKNNFDANVEIAGQFGHQNVYGIDRNIKMLSRSSTDGSVKEVFSHIAFQPTSPHIQPNLGRDKVPVQNLPIDQAPEIYDPQNDLTYIVNSYENRRTDRQGKQITRNGNPVQIPKGAALTNIYNSNLFGNARFRPPFKLDLQGFMIVADVGYTFEKSPFRIAGAIGHISGDNYPYNEEVDKTYRGFIPQRSRYKGRDVRGTLIFDRLVIPRPLNISYRNMYAFNNLKDLSNLEFLGLGLTWYPFKQKDKSYITTDILFFWEHANLYKWDKDGHHPYPVIENQIAYDRAKLGFPGVKPIYQINRPDPSNKGWLSNDHSSRFLGAEINIKAELKLVKECELSGKICFFLPGELYKDLEGQPNILTQYIDAQGLSHYESLGDKFAFAFIVGLDYHF